MAPPKFVINEPIPIRGGLNDKAKKPAMIEITQAMSEPADPDAPSFLTTLPAEIRNAVYEILFIQAKPVGIVDMQEQQKLPEWLEYYQCEVGSIDEETAALEAATFQGRKTHDLHRGLSLLRTCRQIYWEAIGTLYGANEYAVTAPEHRPAHMRLLICTAADFIQSIGTHVSLISTISIDLGRICPDPDEDVLDTELLPLLRVLWSRPSIMPRIVFTVDKFVWNPKICPNSIRGDTLEVDVDRMNQIVHTLFETDQLGLRRCMRFERLLQFVFIDGEAYTRDETFRREMIHHITYRGSPQYTRQFEIGRNDGNLTFSFIKIDSLTELPHEAQKNIIRHALFSSKRNDIEFDLQNHTVTGLNHNILQLDQTLRHAALEIIQSSSQVTLKLQASEAETSFEGFKRLDDWLNGQDGQYFKYIYLRSTYSTDARPAPRLLLYFDTPNATSADLRVSIVSLIRLTHSLLNHTVIEISLGASRENRYAEKVCEVQLQTLRRRCFIMLSEIILQNRAHMKARAPEIWIDGTGMPAKVTWSLPEAACIKRDFVFPSTDAALHQSGLNYIEAINSQHHSRTAPWCISPAHHGVLNGTLGSMWGYLHQSDWTMF